MMLAAISGNGNNLSFKYNDMGIRTEKTVNGVTTKYHLVGDKVTYEDNGTDKIYYTYDAKGKLISMNLNGTEYYYIRNGQGDITGLFDGSGTEVVKCTYDTLGKLISIEGAMADTAGVKNPYRYRGYRYDSETGLHYLQSRYYTPEWGRFVNADAILGSMGTLLSHNMFAYCRNNPVNRVDPYGYHDDEGDGPGKGAAGATGGKYIFKTTYFGKKMKVAWDRLWGRSQGGGYNFTRNIQNVSELNTSSFKNLEYNGVIKVNKSGSDRPLTSTPNSYYTTANGEHVFVYDGNGKLIYDLSSQRVKSFKINISPDGKEYYSDYKLDGVVPDFIKNIFGW